MLCVTLWPSLGPFQQMIERFEHTLFTTTGWLFFLSNCIHTTEIESLYLGLQHTREHAVMQIQKISISLQPVDDSLYTTENILDTSGILEHD